MTGRLEAFSVVDVETLVTVIGYVGGASSADLISASKD